MRSLASRSAFVALIALPALAAAQIVQGRIIESTAGTPVAGAVISLVDSAGASLARTVSGADGRYRLNAAGATWAVRAIHIGFRPLAQSIRRPVSGATTTVDLSLARLPALLESVNVLDQPRCPAAGDGAATFALWEQARAALLATVVAREANPATVRMVSYDRLLSSTDGRIQRQTVSESTFVASQPVVSRRNANEYETLGYRDTTAERGTDRFYAPDADVLLDPAFARGHCLSLHPSDAAHAGEIGLQFSPVAGADSIVDVAGVIWIGEALRSLRSVEFRFASGRRVALGPDSTSGGGLWYHEMPNGLVLPTRWDLHVRLAVRQGLRLRNGVLVARTAEDVGVHDAGGELAEARWSDGVQWESDLPRVHGHVIAGKSEAPVANALVSMRGTPLRTTSDSSGAFSFPSVVPGPYALEAVDLSLSEFSLTLFSSEEILVDRARPDTATLVLPSRAHLVDSICAESRNANVGVPMGSSLLVGHVSLASGEPAVNASGRARWSRSSNAEDVIRLGGRSDSTGTFEICGMPGDVPVSLSATNDSLMSGSRTVTMRGAGDVTRIDLRLGRFDAAVLPAFRRRSIHVEDDASSTPIVDAEVIDATENRLIGRTSETGALNLATLPEGGTLLRVRKPGYELRALMVNVSPNDSTPIELKLRTVTQLAAVKVTATAISKRALMSGFEDRAKMHIGHFLRPADFDKRSNEQLYNVLRNIGVKTYITNTTHEVILLGGHGSGGCPTTIYIDGVLYYSGVLHVAPPDAQRLPTWDYSAAEFYNDSAELPAQFSGTDTGCGVLLLWTKT
ncbi:MAG: carboxypeptidase-like regulatory domain-containing protein [Gemmatimonadaceae bacterium]